jgi:hypothetical protein
MLKQVHFKRTLHQDSPSPGRYREIAVVEQADHFELLIFEGTLLRSDQLTNVQNDWESRRLHPTLDVACSAADEEMRKSLAAGWILYSR